MITPLDAFIAARAAHTEATDRLALLRGKLEEHTSRLRLNRAERLAADAHRTEVESDHELGDATAEQLDAARATVLRLDAEYGDCAAKLESLRAREPDLARAVAARVPALETARRMACAAIIEAARIESSESIDRALAAHARYLAILSAAGLPDTGRCTQHGDVGEPSSIGRRAMALGLNADFTRRGGPSPVKFTDDDLVRMIAGE